MAACTELVSITLCSMEAAQGTGCLDRTWLPPRLS